MEFVPIFCISHAKQEKSDFNSILETVFDQASPLSVPEFDRGLQFELDEISNFCNLLRQNEPY